MPNISRKFTPLLLSLALLSPGVAQADAPDSYVAPIEATYTMSADTLAGYRPLRPADWPVDYAPDEDTLIRDLQDALAGGEGPPASLLISRDGERLLIDVEQTGLADDSVSGQRMRGVFLPDAGGLRLYEAGVQYQCARGAGAGRFTDQLCP